MKLSYILSQVFAIFATITLSASYLVKDKKSILFLCIVTAIFFGVEYFLLGAYTGVAMDVVSIVSNIWFYLNEKNNKKNKIEVLIILLGLMLILSIFTYTNIFSFVSMMASMLFTYSVWQDSTKLYKILAIPTCILWIMYNAYYKSIVGITIQIVLLVFAIIGIVKYQKNVEKKI